jgi:hypothetical protein
MRSDVDDEAKPQAGHGTFERGAHGTIEARGAVTSDMA